MMSFYGMGGLGMLGGFALCVLLIGLIVWGVYSLVSSQSEIERLTALEIIEKRYLRQEISRAEYEQAIRNF